MNNLPAVKLGMIEKVQNEDSPWDFLFLFIAAIITGYYISIKKLKHVLWCLKAGAAPLAEYESERNVLEWMAHADNSIYIKDAAKAGERYLNAGYKTEYKEIRACNGGLTSSAA